MDFRPEENVKRFAETARAYCAWAESPASSPDRDVYQATLLVAGLYVAALILRDVNLAHVEGNPEPEPDPQLKRAAAERFSSLPFQYYWEVFRSVTPEAEEPCCGDIIDDLSDIYVDVKEGLLLFERGLVPAAAWHWRQTFGFHWGTHALSAVKALHDFETNDAA